MKRIFRYPAAEYIEKGSLIYLSNQGFRNWPPKDPPRQMQWADICPISFDQYNQQANLGTRMHKMFKGLGLGDNFVNKVESIRKHDKYIDAGEPETLGHKRITKYSNPAITLEIDYPAEYQAATQCHQPNTPPGLLKIADNTGKWFK